MPMGYGQLQDGRVSRAVQQRFNIPPDFTLSLMPEVAAQIGLDESQPDLLYPIGWKRYAGGSQVGAVAAQNGRVSLRLPGTGTNHVVVVESVIVSTAATATFNASVLKGAAANSNSRSVGVRDVRQPAVAGVPSQALLSDQADAAGGPTVATEQVIVLANTPVELRSLRNVVLFGTVANTAVEVFCQTVNQAFSYTFVWRERLLTDQELALV